jgi:fucose permease
MSVGRLVGGRGLRAVRSTGLALLCCLAAIGVLLIVAGIVGGRGALALLGIAVLFCGPCYALFLGRALATVPHALGASTVSGLIACGAAGGTVIPLLAAAVGIHDAPWVAGIVAIVAVAALVAARSWRQQTDSLSTHSTTTGMKDGAP